MIDAPDANRDVIIRYLAQAGTVDPKAGDNWHFKPVPGATNVVFESNPKADPASVRGVSLVGEGAKGFAKFRIDLAA